MKQFFFITPLLLSLLLFPTFARSENISTEESIRLAFNYSPALKSSQENRQAALHDVDKAKAGYLPTIGIWAGVGAVQNSDYTTRMYGTDSDTQNLAKTSVILTQPLYSGGSTTAQMHTSKAGVEMADSLLLDSANALAFEAVSAHADLLRREKLLVLAQNNLKEHLTILETVKQRYGQGVITSGEVSQIESRVSRAKATQLAQEAGVEAAKANYTRVTGEKLPPSYTLTTVPTPSLTYTTIEETETKAELKNPRVLAAKASIQISQGEKQFAESRFLPTVNMQAGYNNRYQQGINNGNAHDFSVSLNTQWEVFSGGADKANLLRSNAKIRQAEQELQRYIDQLNQDIATTFAKTQSAIKQSEEYAQAMQYAKNTRANFYQQFQGGTRQLLDVLDAESDYFNSASEEEVTKIDALIGHYRLLALTGELLKEVNINPETLKIDTSKKK